MIVTSRGRSYADGPYSFCDRADIHPQPCTCAMPQRGQPVTSVPPTWWQRKWHDVMTWAIVIPCAGYVAPYLHPDLASLPLWHWITGYGLLAAVAAWGFRPGTGRPASSGEAGPEPCP